MATRTLDDAPFQLATALRGAELASPVRRLAAAAIDVVLMFVPSVALAVGAAWMTLRVTEPAALAALERIVSRGGDEASYRAALVDALPLLARHRAEGLPAAAVALIDEGRTGDAADLLIREGYDFLFALDLGDFGEPELRPRTVKVDVGHLIPKALRALALYGAMGAYFTLLTAWGGRTLGKRLAGIRVVRLDGRRLSVLEAGERFAGYLHIPGSFGLAFLDLWHDPNRRMPHDRVINTAVIRVRRLSSRTRGARR
ncbi:MAG: RDD family protein [Acidobacteriota bacterium]